MKFLIAGLGNIGSEYDHTRHNIGFDLLDCFAEKHGAIFAIERLAFYTTVRLKGRVFHLIKPTTYMNLSGKAVRYWLNQLGIEKEHLLVITDDVALPFGKVRIRKKGSDGGHNGLGSIQEWLGSIDYPRMRFGIGSDYPRGLQIDYVLSEWSKTEKKALPQILGQLTEAIADFGLSGIDYTMNKYN